MKRLLNIGRAQPPEDPQKWVPILGELQKTLQKGEYLPLRPLPMFESNFVQVTNHGAPAFVHHRTNKLTMAVAASLPGLVMPDILLLAQPPEDRDCENLNLTRMIPLDLAHLYVHDLPSWRLKLRLITGRYYYLELDAPDHELAFLFDRWIRLINLLHQPTLSWAPRTMDTPPLDTPLDGAPASTWCLQAQPPAGLTVQVTERTFPYKIFSSQKQRKAKVRQPVCMVKHTLRSQAVGDSVPLIWSQLEPLEDQMKVAEKKSCLDPCADSSDTVIQVSDKDSITIRTIFSIISGTLHQEHRSDSEDTMGRGGLIETPTQCISHKNADLPFMDSCDMDTFMWSRDLEDLIDTESTSLSSSLHTYTYPPAFYVIPPGPSCPKSKDKARPIGSTKYLGTLSCKKAPSAPATTRKTPFILDKSTKVQAEPAPARKVPDALRSTQKSSAPPCLSHKAPPSIPQKVPPVPGPPPKAPVLIVSPNKNLSPIQKLPQAPASSQKAMPPKKDCLSLNAQFQKAPTAQLQNVLNTQAKAPVDPTMLLVGDMLQEKPKGKQEPVMFVEGQKTKVVDMRAQTMSSRLSSTTNKKKSKEILISKMQEVTLEALKGREKSEDRAHKMEEETAVNLPDLKPKEIEMQEKWVLAEEVGLEGPRTEDNRPFSVEGLTLAKMMIIANSKHQYLKPATVSLPSWFSMTSRGSAMSVLANLPLNISQMHLTEATQVVLKEQSESSANVKEENTQPQMKGKPGEDSLSTSKEPTTELSTTSISVLRKTPEMSTLPITMTSPSSEDMSQPITSYTTFSTSVTETLDKKSQRPGVKYHELKKAQTQEHPLAVKGSTLESLFPTVLEKENKRKTPRKAEEL
ncbi:Golgi-associated RAB2 interactor protein 5B [Meriones unguiculatus]|uniref:Golgi-associated RAB2 interactor protein 5B n=1 Tax=Meriones unguiculatus TaxID=10047 RepID=UPI000B4FB22B|nr:Golgi-associated RAB2 interactor protein 5B [Meriones unguiculatus]